MTQWIFRKVKSYKLFINDVIFNTFSYDHGQYIHDIHVISDKLRYLYIIFTNLYNLSLSDQN